MKSVPIRGLVQKTKQIDPQKTGRRGFVYIDISAIDREQKRIFSPQKIAVNDAPSRARKLVHSKDVLISTVRPNLNSVAQVPPELNEEIASTGFCVLRANPAKLNADYLFYFAQSYEFVTRLTRLSIGAGYPAVSDGDVLDTEIPLPPLAEQQRIADILSRADRLRRLRRFALEMSDGYLQAVFLEMFGDPVTNPMGWEMVTVADMADIIVPTRDKPKSFSGDVPWFTLPDVDGLFVSTSSNSLTHKEAAEVSNRLMPKNTVLLSCAGTLGRIAITTREAYANQQFYGLVAKPEEADYRFLAIALQILGVEFYFRLAGVSTLGFFSKAKALGINLTKPPLDLQRKYALILERRNRLRAQQREALRQAEHLFQGLLQAAFRGAV